jgi:DNA-binding Xre family transcriptional regulator
MDALKVDRTKLITQTEYAKKVGLTPARINQKIKAGEIKTVTIKGAVLILLD